MSLRLRKKRGAALLEGAGRLLGLTARPALEGGASKASVCRTFKIPRSTLVDTLHRSGWSAPASKASG
jgi:hypothetical protein